MKLNSYKILFLTGTAAITFFLASCLKKFNSDSYMPEKSYGGFTNSNQIEPNHLVAYWSFNGNLNDSSGKESPSLTGTNNGCTFTTGIKGQALEIGAGNYVVFNNPGTIIPNLKSYTITFWMNAPQNTKYGYGIFSLANSKDFWGNLDIYLDNGSSPDFVNFKVHMNNANDKNTGKFQGVHMNNGWNQWVQVAITYDSSTAVSTNFNIYQNGVSVYSTLLKDTTNNYGPLKFVNATAFVIGTWQFQTNPSLTASASAQGWAGSFNGALDEFRIYDKALSAGEVNSLFKLEKAGR